MAIVILLLINEIQKCGPPPYLYIQYMLLQIHTHNVV